jgi:hypothetical protein
MLLRVQYGADRVGLSVYLASQLYEATADLLKLNPDAVPDPRELFDRFVAWTARPPSGERI